MGTINYSTSDIITLAIKPIEYGAECDFDEENIACYYESVTEDAQREIDKMQIMHFNVEVVPGYYDGLQIMISFDFADCIDYSEQRKEIQHDLTQIKKMLIACTIYGFRACVPGWCTSYSDFEDTIAEIKSAIAEWREKAKTIPTWHQLHKRG